MKINNSEFVKSSSNINDCPKRHIPEYAFIGRSNVGKSSLINYLVGKKELAKTSSKPGKTILINHFLINDAWFLVDLPGYGFAKIAKEEQKKISTLISSYFLNRENLLCTFLLLDSRHALQASDKEFIYWMGQNKIPFVIVLTKTDKISVNELKKNMSQIEDQLLQTWEELPPVFYTSSEKKQGKENILEFIAQTNKLF